MAHAQSFPEEVKLRVIVDGKRVAFEDQGPVVLNRRVYVPMRGVLERLGATVSYDRDSRSITATGNGRSVTLPIDGAKGVVDGRAMRLAERPIVMNDRVLIPLRLLSEALGARVDWRAADMTVTITPGEPIEEFATSGTCATPMRVGIKLRL
jgi:hypothetical protein